MRTVYVPPLTLLSVSTKPFSRNFKRVGHGVVIFGYLNNKHNKQFLSQNGEKGSPNCLLQYRLLPLETALHSGKDSSACVDWCLINSREC